MLLIACLGNPEPRFAGNRHNFGFMVAHALADSVGAGTWRTKFRGETVRCRIGDTEIMVVCPMTYMNLSGECIQASMNFYRVPVSDLLVVHDELDLPFGTLRLKRGGGHAGHNGLRSIGQHIGELSFSRLRCGIGKPPPGFAGEVSDYVLSDFSATERAELPEIISKAVKALSMVARRGFDEASNTVNARSRPTKTPKPTTTQQSLERKESSKTVDDSNDALLA